MSLKGKTIFQEEKHYSSLFWNAFQISSNNFLSHRHLNKRNELTLSCRHSRKFQPVENHYDNIMTHHASVVTHAFIYLFYYYSILLHLFYFFLFSIILFHVSHFLKLYVNFSNFWIVSRFNIYAIACINSLNL